MRGRIAAGSHAIVVKGEVVGVEVGDGRVVEPDRAAALAGEVGEGGDVGEGAEIDGVIPVGEVQDRCRCRARPGTRRCRRPRLLRTGSCVRRTNARDNPLLAALSIRLLVNHAVRNSEQQQGARVANASVDPLL